MPKRIRLSGSQYKKKCESKKEKEEEIKRKTLKLDSFFKLKVSVLFINCNYGLKYIFTC